LLGFLAVCATVVFSVAAPALVADLVADRELAAANARVELARTTAFAGGPALGGLLVGWAGPIAAFGVAAIFTTLAAVLLSGIQEPARRPRHGAIPSRISGPAPSSSWLTRCCAPCSLRGSPFNTGFFLLLAIFVPHVVGNLGLSATGTGLTLAMFGVGMVVGALCALDCCASSLALLGGLF